MVGIPGSGFLLSFSRTNTPTVEVVRRSWYVSTRVGEKRHLEVGDDEFYLPGTES